MRATFSNSNSKYITYLHRVTDDGKNLSFVCQCSYFELMQISVFWKLLFHILCHTVIIKVLTSEIHSSAICLELVKLGVYAETASTFTLQSFFSFLRLICNIDFIEPMCYSFFKPRKNYRSHLSMQDIILILRWSNSEERK